MTWREYLPIASLIISLVSAFIAIAGYRRTTKAQRFDYATRIQLSGEKVVLGGVDRDVGFSYETTLENPGSKPLRVDSIYIDYGSSATPANRVRHHIEGEFYLPPAGPANCILDARGE